MVKAHKDIHRSNMEVKAMKENILNFMGMHVFDNKEERHAKLTVSEVERIAKIYRDVCKEKEAYAWNEEFLQQMKTNENVEKELIQIIEEMKKLMGSYNDICKLLNWKFVEEMLKVYTVDDVELLLQNARLWLASGRLRSAISLGKLSTRIDQP